MHPKATEYTKNITLGDKGLILGGKSRELFGTCVVWVCCGFVFFSGG